MAARRMVFAVFRLSHVAGVIGGKPPQVTRVCVKDDEADALKAAASIDWRLSPYVHPLRASELQP